MLKLILCKIKLRLLRRAEGSSIRCFSEGRMTLHLFFSFSHDSCLSFLSLNQQNNTEFGVNCDSDHICNRHESVTQNKFSALKAML